MRLGRGIICFSVKFIVLSIKVKAYNIYLLEKIMSRSLRGDLLGDYQVHSRWPRVVQSGENNLQM